MQIINAIRNGITPVKSMLFLGFVLVFAAGLSKAGTIVAVTRSDVSQYKLTLDSFIDSFNKMDLGYDIRVIDSLDYIGEAEMLDEIEKLQPVLIHTIGTNASLTVKKRFNDVPVIYSIVLEPIEIGLVEKIQKGDNNFTGIDLVLSKKQQVEKLIKFVPALKKIAVIYDKNISGDLLTDLDMEAAKKGLKIISRPVNSPDQTLEILRNVSKETDAIMAIPDGTVYTHSFIRYLLLFSLRNKYPVIGFSYMFAKSGALISLYADYEDIGRQASDMAVRILSGISPSDVPMESPRSLRVALNLKVANLFNIDIPKDRIEEADSIIK